MLNEMANEMTDSVSAKQQAIDHEQKLLDQKGRSIERSAASQAMEVEERVSQELSAAAERAQCRPRSAVRIRHVLLGERHRRMDCRVGGLEVSSLARPSVGAFTPSAEWDALGPRPDEVQRREEWRRVQAVRGGAVAEGHAKHLERSGGGWRSVRS